MNQEIDYESLTLEWVGPYRIQHTAPCDGLGGTYSASHTIPYQLTTTTTCGSIDNWAYKSNCCASTLRKEVE